MGAKSPPTHRAMKKTKTRAPSTHTLKEENKKTKNVLVFAKLEGFRWWPAVVLGNVEKGVREMDEHTRKRLKLPKGKKSREECHLVRFHGTGDVSLLAKDKVCEFNEESFKLYASGGFAGESLEEMRGRLIEKEDEAKPLSSSASPKEDEKKKEEKEKATTKAAKKPSRSAFQKAVEEAVKWERENENGDASSSEDDSDDSDNDEGKEEAKEAKEEDNAKKGKKATDDDVEEEEEEKVVRTTTKTKATPTKDRKKKDVEVNAAAEAAPATEKNKETKKKEKKGVDEKNNNRKKTGGAAAERRESGGKAATSTATPPATTLNKKKTTTSTTRKKKEEGVKQDYEQGKHEEKEKKTEEDASLLGGGGKRKRSGTASPRAEVEEKVDVKREEPEEVPAKPLSSSKEENKEEEEEEEELKAPPAPASPPPPLPPPPLPLEPTKTWLEFSPIEASSFDASMVNDQENATTIQTTTTMMTNNNNNNNSNNIAAVVSIAPNEDIEQSSIVVQNEQMQLEEAHLNRARLTRNQRNNNTNSTTNNNNNKNNNNKEEDFERRSGENSSSGNNRGSSNSLSGGQQRRRYNNNVIGNHNTTTTRTTNADVFHLKDVARAVINPSSSLAQHNLDEMKNSKIEKDPNHKFGTSTINFAIKELGERNDFSRAYALYRWMSTQAFNDESKYSPNAYTFCALASSAKTSREVRIVLEVWRGELKIAKHMLNNNKNTSKATGGKDVDFDSTQSWLARNECASAAIAMTTKIGDWQSALEIFNDVKKIGNVKRNIYTYTAILTALRDSGKADEAEQILYEMLEERNVRVTSLAFSLALGAFEVARMWQEGNKLAKSAFKVFQIDSPDATLTHAIITMAGRAGDLQFASETFENMKNSTLVVTTYSYNALLGGYARYGDWESAHRVFSDLRQAHLQPDRYTYTQLISAAERAGEYEAADVVWREMLTKSRHVVPHTVMCGAYIHCLARQRRNLEAEDVLETMKARWDVPRNAAVYNALIGAHVRAGDVPKALHVYDRMQKEDNIMATEITFAVLIRACEEDGEFVKMADLLQQAKELLAREGKLVMDLTGGGGRGGSNGLF